MTRVTILVLSALALTAFEAFYSSRSLKTSCVACGIVAGAVFYLATAAMKRASRGSDSSSEESGLQETPDPSTQRTEEQVQTHEPPEDVQHSSDSSQEETSLGGSDKVIVKEDDDGEWVHISNDQRTKVDPLDLRSPPGSEQAEPREEKIVLVQATQVVVLTAEVKRSKEGTSGLEGRIQVAVQKSYHQLTLTKGEAKVISTLIQMINDTWVVMLLSKETELLQMGKRIDHLHPLKFLETVLKDPVLKEAMLGIEDSTLKWDGFLNGKSSSSPGFVAKCKREDDQGNFAPYITDFCQVVKADPKKIRPLYEAKNWEELIRFLIKSK
jgi:hypothetical protein